jgi:VWFA-related protein
MRSNSLRLLVLCVLVAVLAVPWDAPFAAAQQSGPVQSPPKQQPPQQQEKKEQKPEDQFTLAVEVPLVTVDVVVTDNRGNYIPDLKKEHFRILEDGVPQQVTNFSPTDAPITAVLVVEYSKLYWGFFSAYATEMGRYFLPNLKKEDWIALVSFDMRPRIEVDFTRNKEEVDQTLRRMWVPGFSEANLFDTIHDVVGRLKDVKGKKAIVILASGYDTFSKKTLDDTLKLLRQTDITIFSVGVGRELFEWLDARGGFSGAWGGVGRTGYYQAENQMRAFAEMTGGRAWFPRFMGEWPGIFQDVAASLRNQYTLGYTPANRMADGKYRKIKVQLVGPDGSPLKVIDQNNKQIKYVVYARQGYIAPKGGVSD